MNANHKILFIDDEIESIEAFRELYEEHFSMVTATSVLEGLKILTDQNISIVITDMRMPDLDGADFMRIANQDYRRPIKIILSAFVEEFFNDQFQTIHRPYAIVRKPLSDPKILLNVLIDATKEYEFRYPSVGAESFHSARPTSEARARILNAANSGFLNAQEILNRLCISKPTLYKFLKSGLPSKRLGGRRLFNWEEVLHWVNQHEFNLNKGSEKQ